MRTQSVDTTPEAERVLIELIRKAPITKRFELVRSWTKSIIQLNQQGVFEHHPYASEKELTQLLLAQKYGQVVADDAEKKLADVSKLPVPDLFVALASLAKIFEHLNISYYIGGSIASSTHGMKQAARDIDIVAGISTEQIGPLITMLQASYYVSDNIAKAAIQQHTSFSMIDLHTLFKIDVITPQLDYFNTQAFKRAHQYSVEKAHHMFYLSSPEDIVLIKLRQYKLNGKHTDDQWNDILGVLKVQGPSLDFAYLARWAAIFEIEEVLESASVDAGLDGGDK